MYRLFLSLTSVLDFMTSYISYFTCLVMQHAVHKKSGLTMKPHELYARYRVISTLLFSSRVNAFTDPTMHRNFASSFRSIFPPHER